MNVDDIAKWLNTNQGVLELIAILIALFGGGGLVGLFIKKRRKNLTQIAKNMVNAENIKAEGDVLVGNIVTKTTNIQTSDTTKLEQQVNEMSSKIDVVLEKMKTSPEPTQSEKKLLAEKFKEKKVFDTKSPKTIESQSEDYQRVMKLIDSGPTDEKKNELKAMLYTSTDLPARLKIALILVEWCKPPKDSLEDLITISDEGIKVSDYLDAKGEKAKLLSYKGSFISWKASLKDAEMAYKIKSFNTIGYPLVTEEEKQNVLNDLVKLENESHICFAQAEKFAKEARDIHSLALVYMNIGTAAGLKYLYLKDFVPARADREKQLCKKALLLTKDIYSALGDELLVAYSYHNLANQLRFFGEVEQAKALTEKVIEIASKYREERLLKKAKGLLNQMVTGRIPDYLGGETNDD